MRHAMNDNTMVAPKVSILIPVYNRQDYLADCIQSALDQTMSDLEIVIVDNASDDGTWLICQEYSSRDCRIRIFRNEMNIGPVRNWQRCIEEARGCYGKILFSDDLMQPTFLEETLSFFEEPEVGFVITGVTLGASPEAGEFRYRFTGKTGSFPSSKFLLDSLTGGDLSVSPGCAIFRMEALRQVLINEIFLRSLKDFSGHGAGPDLLFYLLSARSFSKVAHVCKPLCFFRDHKGSISISENGTYLRNCYNRIRVLFAESYLEDPLVRACCAYIWYEICREKGRWAMPASVLIAFSDTPRALSFWDLFLMLVRRFLRKARRAIGKRGQVASMVGISSRRW